MALPSEYGGLSGALRVSATATITVPANMYIYSIIPQPAWTGILTPLAGYEWYSSDRTSAGTAIPAYSAVHGAYSAISTTSGECDVYLKPIGTM